MEYFGKKYKTNVLGFYLGPQPCIATYGYDLCKEVLTRDEFNARTDSIVFNVRGFGTLPGVIFGTNWKEQRWIGLRYMRDFGFGRRSFKVEDYTEGEIKNLIELFTSEPNPQTRVISIFFFVKPSNNFIFSGCLLQKRNSIHARCFARTLGQHDFACVNSNEI